MKRIGLVMTAVILGAALCQAQQPIDQWQTFTTKDQAFSVQLPPSWTTLDTTSAEHKANLAKIKSNNPHLALSLEESRKKFSLFAIDSSDDGSDHYVDTMNLLVTKAEVADSQLDQIGKSLVSGLGDEYRNSGYRVESGKLGKYLRYWTTYSAAVDQNVTANISAQTMLCSRGGKIYILTFGTLESQMGAKLKIFETAFKSVRLKGSDDLSAVLRPKQFNFHSRAVTHMYPW